MSNLSASLGLSQLSKIDTIMQKRKTVAEKYYNGLRPLESEGLLLLLNQNLTSSQQKYIIKHIKDFFRYEN